MFYFKGVNTLLNYASYSKLSKELKNKIAILAGPVVFKLRIKIVKILF